MNQDPTLRQGPPADTIAPVVGAEQDPHRQEAEQQLGRFALFVGLRLGIAERRMERAIDTSAASEVSAQVMQNVSKGQIDVRLYKGGSSVPTSVNSSARAKGIAHTDRSGELRELSANGMMTPVTRKEQRQQLKASRAAHKGAKFAYELSRSEPVYGTPHQIEAALQQGGRMRPQQRKRMERALELDHHAGHERDHAIHEMVDMLSGTDKTTRAMREKGDRADETVEKERQRIERLLEIQQARTLNPRRRRSR